jgi:hypothetical protein
MMRLLQRKARVHEIFFVSVMYLLFRVNVWAWRYTLHQISARLVRRLARLSTLGRLSGMENSPGANDTKGVRDVIP